ncbi:AAA family ATPase [Frankia sp. AgKG'84/4]|uniref:AAA family ATPase n=1 Tax=Frankia sp. AgKG'84/4 TaxID=573490 RepID=UPI00200F9420|nr:ATP-binding protein [Frankia sp. AgKG'84/4]MCL9794957.1 ATP-binding protein [Frankia sp. AgKG'84/4]
MARPADMFDREVEWERLGRFLGDDTAGATLGVVSGRRRQGKSFLLEAACEQTGGMYVQAVESTAADALRMFGARLAEHIGAPGQLSYGRWDEAIDAVLRLGDRVSTPVVIDEFPYLVKSAPELPSVIQAAFGPRQARRRESRTRLVLCGSALSVMGRLLAGSAPLRGRASLELTVPTLDYRLARQFWGIEDVALATRVHAIVGGTPAYRDFLRGDRPASPDDFDDWVIRAVLDSASPLFREARYLLSEEPDLRDNALYSSVLAAVASGATTRGGIANHVGRASSDLAHPLTVLVDAGLLLRCDDLLRDRRPLWRIAEPLVAFYHAMIRPVFGQLDRPGRAGRVWPALRPTFAAQVLGPHLESLARTWVADFAGPETLGTDLLGDVGHGTVHDHAGRASLELDVVALGPADGARRRLVALGEAKWGTVLGVAHADRLDRARALLAHTRDLDTTATRRILFSAAGFTDALRTQAAADPQIVLVDLDRLHHGS